MIQTQLSNLSLLIVLSMCLPSSVKEEIDITLLTGQVHEVLTYMTLA